MKYLTCKILTSTVITNKNNFKPVFLCSNYLLKIIQCKRTELTQFAFVNGYCTDKYCYLLYSGEQHETVNKNKGKYIYKYDWNGKLIDIVTLDRYITGFAISKDDSSIYAFDTESRKIVFAQF